jgi:hypothetical protein
MKDVERGIFGIRLEVEIRKEGRSKSEPRGRTSQLEGSVHAKA